MTSPLRAGLSCISQTECVTHIQPGEYNQDNTCISINVKDMTYCQPDKGKHHKTGDATSHGNTCMSVNTGDALTGQVNSHGYQDHDNAQLEQQHKNKDNMTHWAHGDMTQQAYTQTHKPLTGAELSANTLSMSILTDNTMSEKEKQLLQELEQQRQSSLKLQQELAELKIQSQIDLEKQKQEQWSTTIAQVKEAQHEAKKQQSEQLANIQQMIKDMVPTKEGDTELLEKLKTLLPMSETQEEKQRRLQQEENRQKNKERAQRLLEQHKQLQEQAEHPTASDLDEETRLLLQLALHSSAAPPEEHHKRPTLDQQQFMEQLRRTLGITKVEDPQKTILKQFLTKSNTTTTLGGATMLKPQLLKQLAGEKEEFNMADWLARFNKQEQGDLPLEFDDKTKHKNSKSGILDKATSNIQHKEVWPQKNLLEDSADEDITFNQMMFEHHMAGEVPTIELCTEPAQILGRLRLLRRMAYAKLRGYEWNLIRKMYAAILTSIEARENTWESSFDRFESILYRKQTMRNSTQARENKKWFCRDYNKPEGCNKNSPHKAPVRATGVIRTVLHICANAT